MNSKVKWRLLATPVAVALFGLPAVACDKLEEAQGALCCKEFTAGADLTGIDWGIEGEAKVSFASFMQASADFVGAASAAVVDIGGACQQLAIDLGEKEDKVTETDPAKRATAWCQLAVAQLNAQVKGKVQLSVQPPSCSFNVSAQASCEAKCTADVQCQAELGNIEARCEPGQLSGKCDAQCTGTCEGSANLAVSCNGTCEGTCEGTCSTGSNNGRCMGTCNGKCRGSCKASAGAKIACEGECTGGCSVKVRAPRCKAELTPPSAKCQGQAECSGSCKASASAKAECKEPSIEIVGTVDPKIIASLKVNLPRVFAIADARGKLLLDNAKAVADFGAKLDPGSLSVKAGACLIPAVNAIGAAVANVEASVSASATIVASVQ